MKQSSNFPRLKSLYRDRVVPEMMVRFRLTNVFQVPRLEKIVLNIGVSEAKENIQALDMAREELASITGQAPQIRRAKKSISNFKLRQGMPIGLKVTLRGDRMYEFMDRMVSLAAPRIRDFRGFSLKGFDGRGAYNVGLKEQHIFPEIDLEKSTKLRGMNITFVTTAGKPEEARALLELLGLPLRKK